MFKKIKILQTKHIFYNNNDCFIVLGKKLNSKNDLYILYVDNYNQLFENEFIRNGIIKTSRINKKASLIYKESDFMSILSDFYNIVQNNNKCNCGHKCNVCKCEIAD